MHSVHFSAFFYALPTVQDTSTRKCRLLHHGYKAVADDSWRNCRLLHHGWLLAQVSSARWRIWRCCNDSWAGSHFVPRILHWLLTEEVEKDQILWVHTYHKTSSRRRGRRVQSLVEIGSEMWICIRYRKDGNKLTNKQKRTKNHFIFIYKILSVSA